MSVAGTSAYPDLPAHGKSQSRPASARTHDILPANSRLKAGSLTGSILATVRPWSSRDGLSAAAFSSWLFDSRTVRLPVCPSGAELLFEVFSQRYERGNTLVTSNMSFDRGRFGRCDAS